MPALPPLPPPPPSFWGMNLPSLQQPSRKQQLHSFKFKSRSMIVMAGVSLCSGFLARLYGPDLNAYQMAVVTTTDSLSSLMDTRWLSGSSASDSNNNSDCMTFGNEEGDDPTKKVVDYAFSEEDLKVFDRHKCVSMEHVCFSGGNRWFYHPVTPGSSRQPVIHLKTDFEQDGGYPRRLILQPNDNDYSHDHTKSCHVSPIPNHIIVTGFHIHMIMEFYARIVLKFYAIWNDLTTAWWKNPTNGTARTDHVQFYIHHGRFSGRQNGKLGSSMLPMMQAFSANPIHLSTHLWDVSGPECHCLERLVMCGFEPKQGKSTTTTTTGVTPTTTITNMAPGKGVSYAHKKNFFNDTRHHIKDQVIQRNPDTLRAIQQFKAKAIQQALKATEEHAHRAQEEATNNLEEWTMIGFSQRTNRRRWLNLDDSLNMCHKEFLWPQKIVCVTIDLEVGTARAPAQQVIQHAGLDVWIGIHGSQQVHQVWLKEHAFVLELLPHLIKEPNHLLGGWAHTTAGPTPNGKACEQTDLNHFSHPLNIQSVPNCTLDFPNKTCDDQLWWGERDFVAPTEVIELFIRQFIVVDDPPPVTTVDDNDEGNHHHHKTTVTSAPLRPCSFYEKHSMEQWFVLMNINCWNENSSKAEIRRWGRDRETFPHLEEYTGVNQQ